MRPPTSPGTSAPSRPERFRLAGPSPALDPRTHAFRNDIADIGLAGRLFAPHYARPEPCACVAPSVMLRAQPAAEAPAVSQLVLGEGFAVLDRAGGWAWGRCLHDDYVGYVPTLALGPPGRATHVVTSPHALVFASASIKAPLVDTLPLGALIVAHDMGDFAETGAGFVHRRHLVPAPEREADWAAVAGRLLGLPYLWGGRGADGIDCSGLVQVALARCGIAAPRDTDLQQAALGRPLGEGEPLARGDLVFFPGHVGIMADGLRLIHANAHWMAVTAEPLADVVARLRPLHASPISARRRVGQ